jgi:cyclohexanone monooxygenase
MDIRGRNDVTLARAWRDGPRAYLGLAVHGFPNMFLITGPGSPSVLGNVVGHIEQHVEYIADLLSDSRSRGAALIEAEHDAQLAWSQRVSQSASATLYPAANSWYLGANVPGKPRVFMPFVGGIGLYRRLCEQLRADEYAGFDRRPAWLYRSRLPDPRRLAVAPSASTNS